MGSEPEKDDLIKVYEGNFDKIPGKEKKEVRIFLSSTFTDTEGERNYLIKEIFPKLRKHCESKGLDFQIIDMRWGIRSELTKDNITTTLCLKEIENCQKYSIGPNFITLLSHKYGNVFLPERIESEEFKKLLDELKIVDSIQLENKIIEKLNTKKEQTITNNHQLIEFCYEMDENLVPARYRLKGLDKIIKEFNDDKDRDLNYKILDMVGKLMKVGAQICKEKGVFNDEQYERYFVSVTQKEVFKGLIKGKDLENNVLYFKRKIVDIEENINDKLAERYIDVIKEGNKKIIDMKMKNLLEELKEKKISECPGMKKSGPKQNIFEFEVNWTDKGITEATHKEYFEKFGNLFYEQTKRLIDTNYAIEKRKFMTFEKEVIDHAIFCRECVQKFHGRDDIIKKLYDYAKSDNKKPFVVSGESGSGKTSILAKFFDEFFRGENERESKRSHKYYGIIRFMGTTTRSSSVVNVYYSIINQIARIFGLDTSIKENLNKIELKEYLKNQIKHLEQTSFNNKKLIIVLDSIDQLNANDYALDWVVEEFPTSVKMIYSTLSNYGDILKNFESKKITTSNNIIDIQSLDFEISQGIIKSWLENSKRRLSDKQTKIIEEMIKKTATLYPLYIKLLFDISSKWPSYYEPTEEFKQCDTIDKCIEYLFDNIEADFGQLFFSRLITYLTSFRNGITNFELEDICSLDDELLQDILEFHDYPVRRFPIALWTRMKHNIENYLVEKEADKTKVINWYHRRFIEVASERYINKLDVSKREAIFTNVIDFFTEKWKNTPKPFKHSQYVAKKKSREEEEKTRDIISQSLQGFADRKVKELPGFLRRLGSNLSFPLSCEYVYFNYRFLIQMFEKCSFPEIMANIEDLFESSTFDLSDDAKSAGNQIRVLSLIFIQCYTSNNQYSKSCVLQILSKSLNFYNDCIYFKKLINQYYMESYNESLLLLPYQFYQPAGGEIVLGFEEHKKPIVHCVIGGIEDSYVFTLSNKINLFNASSLLILGEIQLENKIYNFHLVYFDRLFRETNKLLKDIAGGCLVVSDHEVILYYFESEDQVINKMSFSNSRINQVFLVSSNHILVNFHNTDYFEIYNFHTGDLVVKEKLSKNIKFIECNTPRNYVNNLRHFEKSFHPVYIFVVLESVQILIYTIEGKTTDLTFVSDGKRDLKNNDIKLEMIVKTKQTDVECVSCSFIKEMSPYIINSEHFALTLSSGNVLFIPSLKLKELFVKSIPNEQNNNEKITKVMIFKPKLPDDTKIRFKLLESDSNILLIGSNGHLYFTLSANKNNRLFEIPGSFEDARVVDDYKILAVSKATIFCYVINYNQEHNTFAYVQLFKINAHQDYLSFLFVKDNMVLSTSKDSTLKIHSISNEAHQIKLNLDESKKDILKLDLLDSSNLIAQLVGSNTLDIWNLKTGHIINSINLNKNETIEDVYKSNSFCLVISKEGEKNNKKFHLSGYSFNEKLEFKQDFILNVEKCDYCKILLDDNDKFVFMGQLAEKSDVLMEYLDYNELKILKNINFEDVLKSIYNLPFEKHSNLLEHTCLTPKSKFVVFSFENKFLVYNLKSKELALSKNLKDYELIAKKLIKLEKIKNSDNILCLNESNDLICIRLDDSLDENFKLISTAMSDKKFDGYKLINDVLVLYDMVEGKLIITKLDQLENFFMKESIIFEYELDKTRVYSQFGVTPNLKYAYFLENKRILKFININNKNEISEIPLGNQGRSIVCSNEYISMIIQNRRVISFLIVEKNDEIKTKIKGIHEKITKIDDYDKEINKQIFKRCIGIFEEDSLNKNEVTNEETCSKIPLIKTRKFIENEVIEMNFQDFIDDKTWGIDNKNNHDDKNISKACIIQ